MKKKPITVTCTIIEKRENLEFVIGYSQQSVDLNQPQPQIVPILPGYVAKTEKGKEIYIIENSENPLNLEKDQKVKIHRVPHHWFFYVDKIERPDGKISEENIRW